MDNGNDAKEGVGREVYLEEDNARLLKENEDLSKEIALLKTDLQRRAQEEQGGALLEELIGSRTDPLFKRAYEQAQSEELAAFAPEKRYELAYLLCLGRDAREGVGVSAPVRSGGYPPPFSPSVGGGQVPLSAVSAPTSFEMAKENAKKYFRH